MIQFLSNSKSSISFESFISEIKNGRRDFLEVLKTPEKNFETSTFQELLSNTDDVLIGVNRVQKNFSYLYVDVFDGCLIKHHDNGDIKFVFYTITQDYNAILKICSTLFNGFGPGIYDDSRFIPFTHYEQIKHLAENTNLKEKDIVHYWPYENIGSVLQYRTSPMHEFSLMITIHAPRVKDISIRSNGTILNVLNFDINEAFFYSEEIEQRQEGNNQGVKFIDYTFRLNKKQLNVFDSITIRMFGDKRFFRKEVQTHVTLFSSQKVTTESIITVVERLIKIYGSDDSGSGEIEFHERSTIEKGRFWLGRRWNFNKSHGLWNISNKDEDLSYAVSVDYDDEDGFKIFILAFNQLVDLFGKND